MRRALLILGLVVVLAAAGVGVYVVKVRPSATASNPGTKPSATTTAPTTVTPVNRAALLGTLTPPSTSPTTSAVARALRRVAKSKALGPRFEGEAVDVSTGRVLWRDRPTVAVPPASTAKLLTAVAALSVLGPQNHLRTRTVLRGRTVWLVGGGDVTMTAHPIAAGTYPLPGTLSSLATETAKALRSSGVTTIRLRLDTSAEVGPVLAHGWRSDYFSEADITPPSALEVDEGDVSTVSEERVLDPAAVVGTDFVDDLEARHIRVKGTPTVAAAPVGAKPIGLVDSPTIAALVQEMLTNSDDDLGETLARAVARADGDPGSFRDGAADVLAADSAVGININGAKMFDGSGLSHADRVSPATLISLLKLLASDTDPKLAAVAEGLPVAGFSGTLEDRYRTAPELKAAGEVRAKTGTLDGVSALAGLIVDRSGDLLAFSINAPRAPSAYETEPALDAIAATLANCGCR